MQTLAANALLTAVCFARMSINPTPATSLGLVEDETADFVAASEKPKQLWRQRY